jgi:hypothetical protein
MSVLGVFFLYRIGRVFLMSRLAQRLLERHTRNARIPTDIRTSNRCSAGQQYRRCWMQAAVRTRRR